MATAKKGYKVSYSIKTQNGWKRDETAITYKTKADAEKYAKQLNKGVSYKNARVKKV